jgi:hypothetical protein
MGTYSIFPQRRGSLYGQPGCTSFHLSKRSCMYNQLMSHTNLLTSTHQSEDASFNQSLIYFDKIGIDDLNHSLSRFSRNSAIYNYNDRDLHVQGSVEIEFPWMQKCCVSVVVVIIDEFTIPSMSFIAVYRCQYCLYEYTLEVQRCCDVSSEYMGSVLRALQRLTSH